MTLDEVLKRPQEGPRFIYTTDWHARNRPPRNRTDDYRAALVEKLSWSIDAGNSLGAEKTMICGGDVFDVPTPNLEVADEIIDLFLSKDWRLATALGNHDLDGGISTALRTVLGHLMRRGFISLLPILGHSPLTLSEVQFWGHHYAYGNHNDDLMVEGDPTKVRIIVSHSMTLEKEAPYEHRLFDDIRTNADVLCLGHYHPTQGAVELRNEASTLTCAPGALMRGALSTSDIKRTPSLALIEVASRHKITVDYIPIECAAPAERIFKLDVFNANKARENSLANFVSNLDNLKVSGLDAASIVLTIANRDDVEAEVREEALRRLGVL